MKNKGRFNFKFFVVTPIDQEYRGVKNVEMEDLVMRFFAGKPNCRWSGKYEDSIYAAVKVE